MKKIEIIEIEKEEKFLEIEKRDLSLYTDDFLSIFEKEFEYNPVYLGMIDKLIFALQFKHAENQIKKLEEIKTLLETHGHVSRFFGETKDKNKTLDYAKENRFLSFPAIITWILIGIVTGIVVEYVKSKWIDDKTELRCTGGKKRLDKCTYEKCENGKPTGQTTTVTTQVVIVEPTKCKIVIYTTPPNVNLSTQTHTSQ